MKKIILYFLAAVALTACSDDDLLPNSKLTYEQNGDGTITTNCVMFPTRVDGCFAVSADMARSMLWREEHNEWWDASNEMYVSATSIKPPQGVMSDNAGRATPFGYGGEGAETRFDALFKDGGLKVSATFHKGGEEHTWFEGEIFKRKMEGGLAGRWQPDVPQYWHRDADKYTIYAWSTYNIGFTSGEGDNIRQHQVFTDNPNPKDPTITYDTNAWPQNQPDIVVAKVEVNGVEHCDALDQSHGNLADRDNIRWQAPKFTHILGGLRVRMAVRPGERRLNRIDVFNVPVSKGTYHIKTDSWDIDDSAPAVGIYTSLETEADLKHPNHNFNHIDLKDHIYNDIVDPEQTFMLIPQTFKSDTKLVLYWADKDMVKNSYPTGGTSKTEISLDGVRIEPGKITYIDVQEGSVYVEGVRSFREFGYNHWEYPLCKPQGDDAKNYKYFLRLKEENGITYYATEENSPAIFDWHVPATEAEDTKAWEDGNNYYFGHSYKFRIKARVRNNKDYDNKKDSSKENRNLFMYICPEDMRKNFFIHKKEVTYRYKQRTDAINEDGTKTPDKAYTRESYLRDHSWPEAPGDWNDEDWRLRDYSGTWDCLGGAIDIKIVPDGVGSEYGNITFTPHVNDGFGQRYPIYWPARMWISGSVNHNPYLVVEPYQYGDASGNQGYTSPTGDPKNDKEHYGNVRSARSHWMFLANEGTRSNKEYGPYLDGEDINDGIYLGTMIVTQWMPFLDSDNKYHVYDDWIKPHGHGSVIFYASCLHGSYGHSALAPDEYESRLGVVADDFKAGIECKAYSSSYDFTVENVAHTYGGSYFKIPTGTWHVKYNMSKKKMTFHRDAEITPTENSAFRWCAKPHEQCQQYWWDYGASWGSNYYPH